MKDLKIVKLSASNIKRIRAVEIVPNGNTVTISGKNDAGKTSVLDSIEFALAGKDSICERPIRDGSTKAKIEVDLGELVVTRSFSASGGSSLKVAAKDGSALSSPQSILDSLYTKIGFDPLLFVRMKPAEQKEQLRKLVGLDFSKIDAERLAAYNERTTINRSLDGARGKLAAYQQNPDVPDEEVKVSDLMTELSAIQEHNRQNQLVKKDWEAASSVVVSRENAVRQQEQEIEEVRQQLKDLEAGLKKMKSELKLTQDHRDALEKVVAGLVYKDEQAIKDRISQADDVNAKVRSNARRKELAKEVLDLEQKSESLTTKIQDLDDQKGQLLKDAKFPLPGLSFDETGVLLNGVPFSQGSQARQLQAAVAIGLALNPKLKVILIRDASLLDDDSMQLIKDMADKHNAQVWLEVVNSKDKSAIVIEDGLVKE